MKKILVCLGIGLFLFSCNKTKDNKIQISSNNVEAQEQKDDPIPLGQEEEGRGHPGVSPEEQFKDAHQSQEKTPKVKRAIVIPDSVKGKWKAVKLLIKEKQGDKSETKEVVLNSEFDIPNSKIHVQVKEFLPHLMLGEDNFTSISNELNNPAVHLVISEQGKELYDGWAYSKFPDMYNFQHAKYSVTLVDFIPAK
jgi:hypothetical protein